MNEQELNPFRDSNWSKNKVKDEPNYVWRGEYKEWQRDKWGFVVRGLGDLWTITCRMLIITDDKSDWAKTSLWKVFYHLIQNKRWPDEYNNEYIAKNTIQFYWSKLLYDLKLRPTRLYRSQHGITRDPWIYFMCAMVHIGQTWAFKCRPPWWLYRPIVWEWFKAMEGKKNKYLFFVRFRPKRRPNYVKMMDDYMDKYYEITNIDKMR